MTLKSFTLALIGAVALAGCVQSTAIPLRKDVWDLQVSGAGLLNIGAVDGAVSKKAAALTISKGFERFVILRSGSQSGSVYVGQTPVQGNVTSQVSGRTIFTNGTFSGGGPVYMPTKQTAVRVKMFNAGDVGYDQAVDAKSLL